MDNAPPRPGRLIHPVASAMVTAPSACGLAFALVAVLMKDIVWAGAAGFAAGALLRRGDARVATAAFTALLLKAGIGILDAPLLVGKANEFNVWWIQIVAVT